MKNVLVIVSVAVLICGFTSCASSKIFDYPQPGFDQPFSYVIDVEDIRGDFEDFIKFHNSSSDSGIDFNVYMHNPQTHEWILYGTAYLTAKGDTDTIDTEIKTTDKYIDRYRYFAIESLNGKNYRYVFYASSNDLYIEILDK